MSLLFFGISWTLIWLNWLFFFLMSLSILSIISFRWLFISIISFLLFISWITSSICPFNMVNLLFNIFSHFVHILLSFSQTLTLILFSFLISSKVFSRFNLFSPKKKVNDSTFLFIFLEKIEQISSIFWSLVHDIDIIFPL